MTTAGFDRRVASGETHVFTIRPAAIRRRKLKTKKGLKSTDVVPN